MSTHEPEPSTAAALALSLLPGLGPNRIRILREHFGSLGAILAASAAELARVSGIGPQLASVIHHWRQHADVDQQWRQCQAAGVQLISLDSPDYPPLLLTIPDPPVLLHIRGQLPGRSQPWLAIVGTREASSYGLDMAKRLAAAASQAQWPVVSGLALGIDTAAHAASLEHGGPTVAVLGSGLGRIYPGENTSLARRIVEQGGALVSEFPLMEGPQKHHFPLRNRIIAGLCDGLVVVEAGLKSGSLITAGLALDNGREVMAVPGRADQPQARGCHRLLKDGAALIEDFPDVRAAMRQDSPAPSQRPSPAESDLHLSESERLIMCSLRQGERHADELAEVSSLSPGELGLALLELEARRLIRLLPGRMVEATSASH